MSETDFKRLDAMTDAEIDYSDIPPLTEEQLAAMRPLKEVFPEWFPPQVRVTLGIDADIVAWFKEQIQQVGGGNYQSLMNRALRTYVDSHKESLEETLRRVIREELQVVH